MIPVCPRCDQRLILLDFEQTMVDYCHHCCGVWLDQGEIEELLQRRGGNVRGEEDKLVVSASASSDKIFCPRCDLPLQSVCPKGKEQNLQLDRCPAGHGLWFDSGELQEWMASFDPESNAGKTIQYLNEVFANVKNK